MGWWTHFRRTWRPGYGSDVIDPNKAFDFERRLILIKKIIFIVILLALLIGVICIVVSVSSNGGTNQSVRNNVTPGQQQLTSAKEENISIAALFPSLLHEENINGSIVFVPQNDGHSHNDSLSTTTEPSLKSSDNSSSVSSPHSSEENSTSIETHDASELSCSASGNGLECVGLSKAFKTVMTFGTNSKHNESDVVEGYVMVKMNNSTWHPYCHPHWTLEMGYSLCRGLGFHRLLKLQTIDIEQLKQRITRLGKDVSLHSETTSRAPDLLVVTTSTDSSVDHLKSNPNQYVCFVGYISCN